MAATTTAVENQEKQEKVSIMRQLYTYHKTEVKTDLVLRDTPRRKFSFKVEVDFPEISFKDSHDGKNTISMFTFIHDPTIQDYTLKRLVEFRTIAESRFLKSSTEAYHAGDKVLGDANKRLAEMAGNMSYGEGFDDHYAPRLMTLSVECSNWEFGSEVMKAGIVSMLKEVGYKMQEIFEPKPFTPRK
jgi:hypothetical protein